MRRIRAMLPVEQVLYSIGPLWAGAWKLYNIDGSDWHSVLFVGVRHVGSLSISPPAWLLNALIRAGLMALDPIPPPEVDELREQNRKVCDAARGVS